MRLIKHGIPNVSSGLVLALTAAVAPAAESVITIITGRLFRPPWAQWFWFGGHAWKRVGMVCGLLSGRRRCARRGQYREHPAAGVPGRFILERCWLPVRLPFREQPQPCLLVRRVSGGVGRWSMSRGSGDVRRRSPSEPMSEARPKNLNWAAYDLRKAELCVRLQTPHFHDRRAFVPGWRPDGRVRGAVGRPAPNALGGADH